MLIDSGANKVYIILVYIKCWRFALRYKKEFYFLDIADETLIVCKKEIMD